MNEKERLRLLAARGITENWLKEKGHLPEVALARGYYRVSKDSAEDLARFRAEYQRHPQPWGKAFMTRLFNQQNGLMRPHYPPPGMDAELRKLHHGDPRIFTQFRPDEEVRTGAWEDHEPHWNAHGWRYHLVRHEDHGGRDMSNAEVDALTVDEIRAIASEGRLPWSQKHRHIDTGRFINVPAPKCDHEVEHDHATAYQDRPKLLAAHVKRHHEGEDVLGPHSHKMRVKDKRYEYAKRIDVNPLVTKERLEAAEVIIFGIEGAQKADTAFSAIIRNGWTVCGRPAAVISCPAVGQWLARELDPFMGLYGQGKIFLVVADSDAYEKPDVMTQAFLCREELLRLDAAEAHVVLPKEEAKGEKVGLDDSLGHYKRRLEDCIIQHRDLPPWNETYATMFVGFDVRGTRRESRNGGASLVQSSIAIYSDPVTGDYKASQRAQARQAGWTQRRVGRRLHNLVAWGHLEIVEGSLEIAQSDYSYEDTYPRTPTLRLHESLRATARQQTMGDFFAERDRERNDMTNTAVIDSLARIELMQKMHGEAMDSVRQTVADALERLQDPRLDQAARDLGLVEDDLNDDEVRDS